MNHFENGRQKALQDIRNGCFFNTYTLKTNARVLAKGRDLGKELTWAEAGHLAEQVKMGAWDDTDVIDHIKRSSYAKLDTKQPTVRTTTGPYYK